MDMAPCGATGLTGWRGGVTPAALVVFFDNQGKRLSRPVDGAKGAVRLDGYATDQRPP
jgi:hypothetical protein